MPHNEPETFESLVGSVGFFAQLVMELCISRVFFRHRLLPNESNVMWSYQGKHRCNIRTWWLYWTTSIVLVTDCFCWLTCTLGHVSFSHQQLVSVGHCVARVRGLRVSIMFIHSSIMWLYSQVKMSASKVYSWIWITSTNHVWNEDKTKRKHSHLPIAFNFIIPLQVKKKKGLMVFITVVQGGIQVYIHFQTTDSL